MHNTFIQKAAYKMLMKFAYLNSDTVRAIHRATFLGFRNRGSPTCVGTKSGLPTTLFSPVFHLLRYF